MRGTVWDLLGRECLNGDERECGGYFRGIFKWAREECVGPLGCCKCCDWKHSEQIGWLLVLLRGWGASRAWLGQCPCALQHTGMGWDGFLARLGRSWASHESHGPLQPPQQLGKKCSSTIGAAPLTSQLSSPFKIWLPDVAGGSRQLQSQPGVGAFPLCPGDDCTAPLLRPAVRPGCSLGHQGWSAAQLHLVR